MDTAVHSVFLPGEFHGQRSLVGCSPWGYKELNMTEHVLTHTSGCILRASYDWAKDQQRTETLKNLTFRDAVPRQMCIKAKPDLKLLFLIPVSQDAPSLELSTLLWSRECALFNTELPPNLAETSGSSLHLTPSRETEFTKAPKIQHLCFCLELWTNMVDP